MKFHFKGIHIVSSSMTFLFSLGMASAVTVFPFVFYANKYIAKRDTTRTHEQIHLQQQLECGLAGVFVFIVGFVLFDWGLVLLPAVFLFYILYFAMYLVNLVRIKDKYEAYRQIPFEREAFNNDNIPMYPELRKPFAWIKRL